MINERLTSFILKNHWTLLGVGPMSLNCIDATIELSNDYDVPIMMIASRRQIDSIEFGGGYVNKWTTAEFAEYVSNKDKKGKIILARDHGGPWQSTKETAALMSLREAMKSSKLSFKADIDAGLQILHIDPSVDIHGKPAVDEIIDRVFELYEFCWEQAQQKMRDVIFEVGTEEQSGSTNSQEELDYTLNAIKKFCSKNKLPQPTFVVIQCGTRVMEMRNVGSFDSPIRVANEIPAEIQLPKMIEICNKYGVYMKEHNTDYLSDEALQWHPRMGIHAANVAPEFGVVESKALVHVLENNGLNIYSERFLQIAYDSNKWNKWMLENTKATDRDRSMIAGHYVFSHPEIMELKIEAASELKSKGIILEKYLKLEVKKSIFRYLHNFRIVKSA